MYTIQCTSYKISVQKLHTIFIKCAMNTFLDLYVCIKVCLSDWQSLGNLCAFQHVNTN